MPVNAAPWPGNFAHAPAGALRGNASIPCAKTPLCPKPVSDLKFQPQSQPLAPKDEFEEHAVLYPGAVVNRIDTRLPLEDFMHGTGEMNNIPVDKSPVQLILNSP